MGIDRYGIDVLAPKMKPWKKKIFNFILNSLPFLYVKKTNKILGMYDHLKEGEFMTQVNKELGVKVSHSGSTDVSRPGPMTIVANHPGGADVTAVIETLWIYRHKFKILANKLVCVTPVDNIVIPVDTMSKSKKLDYNLVHQAYKDDYAVIFFAAGKNSRYNENGELKDRDWRPTFLDFAEQYKTPIITLHIDTKNSPLFYKVAKFRERFSFLKNVPLENIFQLREFHIQKDPIHVTISPIIEYDSWRPYYEKGNTKLNRRLATYLYKMTYSMPKHFINFEQWMKENG